jgi:hypothetical protein
LVVERAQGRIGAGLLCLQPHRVHVQSKQVGERMPRFLLQLAQRRAEQADVAGLDVDVIEHIAPLDAGVDLLADEQHQAHHGDADGDEELGADRQVGEAPGHDGPR